MKYVKLIFTTIAFSHIILIADENLYPGEFRIVVQNPQFKSISISVGSVGTVWDSAFNISSAYSGGSIIFDSSFTYSFDHVFDFAHRQAGRYIGYGKYKILIYVDDIEKCNFYIDFSCGNYNVNFEYGEADLQLDYYVVGDSIQQISPGLTSFRVYNYETRNIWDQTTIPQGSPNKNKFQPTNPVNLEVTNSSGNPQLQWSGSTPSVATYNVFRNDTKITTTPLSSTSFTDYDFAFGSGMQQTYKIQAVSGDGIKTSPGFSNSVTINAAPVKQNVNIVKISETLNAQNFPNPFNPTTTIRYDVNEEANVTISVFDVLGRIVKEVVNEFQTMGKKEIRFDARG